MIEPHTHDESGRVVVSAPSEAEAAVDAVEVETRADVEIARINADTQVALAKLAVKAEESHDETEVESLRSELKGMREILDRLVGDGDPEPEPMPTPAPVIVAQDLDTGDEIPAPEPVETDHPEPKKNRSLGLWG